MVGRRKGGLRGSIEEQRLCKGSHCWRTNRRGGGGGGGWGEALVKKLKT